MICKSLYAETGIEFVSDYEEFKKAVAGQPYNGVSDGHFMGYVSGVAEADPYIIYPKGTIGKQLFHVVGKWIDNHPERWTDIPVTNVITALSEAFPLQKSK